MANLAFRKLHRKVAPIVFLPLALTAFTGIAYRLGESWFGMQGEAANIFMVIHQGEYLGSQLKPIYVLLVGLGLLGMIVTGLTMTRLFGSSRSARPGTKLDFRKVHRILSPLVFLPLVLSAVSGVIYRLGTSWFGMSSEQAELFMVIHQGEYLGDFFESIYVLLVGLGLLAMLVTGINMTRLFRRSRQN
ncbi:MAG TPA: hypothetical protein V6D14_14590 [Coleofasciculaceae cyanobacterium]|jgi:hypothetical protein